MCTLLNDEELQQIKIGKKWAQLQKQIAYTQLIKQWVLTFGTVINSRPHSLSARLHELKN